MGKIIKQLNGSRKKKQSTRYHGNDKQTQMELGWSCGEKNRQGLQILLMSGVSVTSASQILESFWNIWSQVSDFPARGPGMYTLS